MRGPRLSFSSSSSSPRRRFLSARSMGKVGGDCSDSDSRLLEAAIEPAAVPFKRVELVGAPSSSTQRASPLSMLSRSFH